MSLYPRNENLRPPTLGWNILHSLWLLWGLLSIGMLFFIGFINIAVRIRRPLWTVVASLMTVINVGCFVVIILSADNDALVPLGGSLLMAGVVVGFGFGLPMNPGWLLFLWEQRNGVTLAQLRREQEAEWEARHPDETLWMRQPGGSMVSSRSWTAGSAGPARPAGAGAAGGARGFLGGGRPPALGAPPVNLNTADAYTLAEVPGIDTALAARIVGERAARGPYQEVTDLVGRGVVAPHVFLGFSTRLVVTGAGAGARPAAPAPRPGPAAGSPQEPGRRLEF